MPKIRFSENSNASTVIYYVALAVIFPWQSLYLVPGNHTMILRTIKLLREEGYLLVSGKGQEKSIKLAKKSLAILDNIRPGLYDYYMFNSENHTFRGVRANDKATRMQLTSRKHRIAETYCMCAMTNCNILFSEKPVLQTGFSNEDLSASLSAPAFYNSREIKNIDEAQRHKTEFSRIAGLLVSLGGCYNIYNVHKGLIKWNQYGENKAKVLTSDIINANFSTLFGQTSTFQSDSAIMLAKDFSAAAAFLASKGSRPDSNGFELISFDNTYSDIYLLPLDLFGALQMKIITTPNWHSRLMQCIFGSDPGEIQTNVDCDNVIDGKYILSILDGNIARLKRFNQSIFEGSPKDYELLCFPWQTETVKEILDFDIRIIEINTEDLVNTFFQTEGDD